MPSELQPIPQHHALIPLHIVEGVFRRKHFVGAVFLGVFGIAVMAAFLLPKRYQAEMKLLVNNSRPQVLLSADPGLTPQVVPVSETDVNTQMDLLDSADLLKKVVLKTGLERRLSERAGESEDQRSERAVEQLRSDLSVTNLHSSNVILVRYTASSPALAQRVLEAISQEYTTFGLDLHRSAGAERVFAAQANYYQGQLLHSQQQLADFHSKNATSGIGQQMDLTVRNLVETRKTLEDNSAEFDEVSGNADELRKEIANRAGTIDETKILPNQDTAEHLATVVADLRNQRTILADKFKPGDRAITEVDGEIASTRQALKRAQDFTFSEKTILPNPVVEDLETDLARAQGLQAGLAAKRASLAAIMAAAKNRLSGYESAALTEARLQETIKEDQANYELYARKEAEARIATSLDRERIANVSIAENPVTQSTPFFPKRSVFLSLGFILATFSSLGGAVVAEAVSDRLYTPKEIERRSGIPVLATLPATHRRGLHGA